MVLSLLDLPNEVLEHILSNITDVEDICSVSLTCKKLYYNCRNSIYTINGPYHISNLAFISNFPRIKNIECPLLIDRFDSYHDMFLTKLKLQRLHLCLRLLYNNDYTELINFLASNTQLKDYVIEYLSGNMNSHHKFKQLTFSINNIIKPILINIDVSHLVRNHHSTLMIDTYDIYTMSYVKNILRKKNNIESINLYTDIKYTLTELIKINNKIKNISVYNSINYEDIHSFFNVHYIVEGNDIYNFVCLFNYKRGDNNGKFTFTLKIDNNLHYEIRRIKEEKINKLYTTRWSTGHDIVLLRKEINSWDSMIKEHARFKVIPQYKNLYIIDAYDEKELIDSNIMYEVLQRSITHRLIVTDEIITFFYGEGNAVFV